MPNFKGGQDRQHRKMHFELPSMSRDELLLMKQAEYVRKELGDEAAEEFLNEARRRAQENPAGLATEPGSPITGSR